MTRALSAVTFGLALLLLLLQAALSVRGLVTPGASAASFGVPVEDPAALVYQLVYRSRNLVIAATGLVFLFAGMWRALAIMTTAAIALPVFDILFLKAASIPVAAVHPATLVALVILAGLLWARVRLT